ncbi:hypothetical protein [Curtobacterium sp. Leaf261]|uniref:hypothetical protein n=1 Tax=Curtobacterium sp. Leaf261 TaxID=1736311 RepID=UPI0006FE1EA3|nr:hypothetical protein [Curtobacterium sp. Leaf261]KQO65039.1 hypothetical protein ASF23_02560 [Curtobacterium sp. Leaf261]
MVVIASTVEGLLLRRAVQPTDSRARQLSREAARGTLERVARGVYVDAAIWSRARPVERHLLLVHAAATRPDFRATVSHQSAAAMLGWPRIGPYPRLVQATDPQRATSRTGALVRWHVAALDAADVIEIDGVRVTAPLRTLRDVLMTSERRDAVAVADFAIGHAFVREADAVRTLDLLTPVRGSRRARDALAFADPDADSPGESYSRVVIDELGFPPPRTQVEFRLDDRFLGRVDFWWPEFGVIGEFDGHVKYTRGGMDGARVLTNEKRREDGLRRHAKVRGVARWTWDALEHPERLAQILLRAGVRRS